MFRSFTEEDGWRKKRNFVDDNNVLVGYDMADHCCEYADWFIADQEVTEVEDYGSNLAEFCTEENKPKELEEFQFDPDYYKEIRDTPDDGNRVIFRLTNWEDEKFLHIFNIHNGYYGHGFNYEIGEKEKRSGVL